MPQSLGSALQQHSLVPGASVSVVAPGLREDQRVSPAPFTSPRAAGPDPISSPLLFEKFGQERYAREGVPLSLSTLADQVGAGCAVPEPLLRRIERHVSAPSVCMATTRPYPCSPVGSPISKPVPGRKAEGKAQATAAVTAKMNDIDPQVWLADVLGRIAGHPAHRLDDLLPWNWRPAGTAISRAA